MEKKMTIPKVHSKQRKLTPMQKVVATKILKAIKERDRKKHEEILKEI